MPAYTWPLHGPKWGGRHFRWGLWNTGIIFRLSSLQLLLTMFSRNGWIKFGQKTFPISPIDWTLLTQPPSFVTHYSLNNYLKTILCCPTIAFQLKRWKDGDSKSYIAPLHRSITTYSVKFNAFFSILRRDSNWALNHTCVPQYVWRRTCLFLSWTISKFRRACVAAMK